MPCYSRNVRGGNIERFGYRLSYLGCPDFVGLLALDAAYHHISWLYLLRGWNVLYFADRDRDLGEL